VVWLCWLGLLLAAVGSRAAEPVKPPWQRLLQGEDARKTVQQEKQLGQLQEAGKFAEALKVAEALAELRGKVQGADHWQAANARWEVELLRRLLRQEAEGRQAYARAMALRRQAKSLQAKGRFREARPFLEETLSVQRQVLGEEHPDAATVYADLAYNLNVQGKYSEAEAASRKALAIRRKTLGEEHPETAGSYEDVANDSQDQGKDAEGEANHRTALAIRRRVLGEENRDTAKSYNNLAMILYEQGRYAEAEVGFRKALDIFRKVLGEEHPDTATGYNNVALNLNAQGRHAEAEAGFGKALAISRKTRGEEHRGTAIDYNNVASSLEGQGRYAEAEEGYRKALDIWRKVLGEDHPVTAIGYNNVASSLRGQGRYAEAEEQFRKALDIFRKRLGEEHPRTASALRNLAGNLHEQGKYAEAEASHRKALAIRRQALGEEHPDTAYAYLNLAVNLHAQGKYAQAEAYGTDAANSFAKARTRLASSGLGRVAATGKASPLPFLAAVLAGNGKPEAAWQRFEEGLARGTWDDLTARLRRPPDEQARQTAFVNRLNRLDQLIENTLTAQEPTAEQKKRREELLTERRKVQDDFDAFAAHLEKTYGPAAGQVFDRPHIQKSLPADAALVGWLDLPGKAQEADPDGEHWAVLLRSAGPPRWIRLRGSGPQDAWTESDGGLPAELRAALQTPAGDWQPLAQRLRRQRLQPLAKHLDAGDGLPAVRHLIVLPSTALAGVPVEAFADGYTVGYALSGTLYAHLRQQPRPDSQGLLALADPVFDPPAVADKPPPLPPGGVLVTMVVPGSPAAQAGLQPNDVLLRYGDTELTGPADFKPEKQPANSAPRVSLVVWREGETLPKPLSVPAGKLGVLVANQPAPQALAEQRRLDRRLASRGGDDWPRLPGTRYEVASIQRLFGGAAAQVLLDSDASEQQLSALAGRGVLGRYRYVHLGTHGEVDNVLPLRSAVILARDHLPDERQRQELLQAGRPIPDGRLTAQEVLRQWNLHSDLVTLSACQTALGKYERGEGFVGFAQALILAGSRAVCLSLWKVNDAATALLMERFYQNLLGKRDGLQAPLPKAAALAEAKEWLRKLPRAEALKRAAALSEGVERGLRPKLPRLEVPPAPQKAADAACPYAHPYYWAAFVLIGDPE
jgi:tetratricopeptide (TPR) repeat protein